jgi:HemY protein
MRRFIWILIILIFSVWLGLQIAKDPGLAFFSYRHWSVEMPLWFALFSFIVLLLVLYTIIRFFNQIDASFYRWKSWLKWRRKNKSFNKTNRGLIEALEGQWKNAEYYLNEGLAQSDAPLINYLALAKSAHEQKAFDRRDTYLRKAHLAAPQADIAIGIMQVQLQLNQGQLEQALATLDHLRHVAPRHALVLKLLERVYIHLGDWRHVLEIAPCLYKAKVITRDELTKLELHVYNELLNSTTNRSDHLTALQTIWRSIPKKLQTNPPLVYSYTHQLVVYPEQSIEAEELIYKTLKKSWDARLARLYGTIILPNTKIQLTHAESLLKRYGKQAMLLLTLGKISVQCQLWGKARTYFEESLHLEANQETYMEYGKLLEHLGDLPGAMNSYREGLLCQLRY